jgi:hypothetical protein
MTDNEDYKDKYQQPAHSHLPEYFFDKIRLQINDRLDLQHLIYAIDSFRLIKSDEPDIGTFFSDVALDDGLRTEILSFIISNRDKNVFATKFPSDCEFVKNKEGGIDILYNYGYTPKKSIQFLTNHTNATLLLKLAYYDAKSEKGHIVLVKFKQQKGVITGISIFDASGSFLFESFDEKILIRDLLSLVGLGVIKGVKLTHMIDKDLQKGEMSIFNTGLCVIWSYVFLYLICNEYQKSTISEIKKFLHSLDSTTDSLFYKNQVLSVFLYDIMIPMEKANPYIFASTYQPREEESDDDEWRNRWD